MDSAPRSRANSHSNKAAEPTQPAAAPAAASAAPPARLPEVLPKAGLVYSEKGNLGEILCKPKIMAIKSVTLEKIENMEKQAMQQAKQQQGE